MSGVKNTDFLKRVEEAGSALQEILAPTPLQLNAYLSDKYGARVYLKREDLTPVRSYKIRGAFNFFRKAIARSKKKPKFVCASAGNHAQGFAFACAHFGVKGIVYMPVTTPQQKIDKTTVFGNNQVEIRIYGDFFDQCNQEAINFAKKSGAILVPPFDHLDVIEGQASVANEILDTITEPIDSVILPVGGGGLAAGVASVFKARSPKTKIIFVQAAGAPAFKESLKAGKRVKLDEVDNFVDGAAVGQMGKLNFEMLKHYEPDNVLLIKEDHVCETMLELLNIEGIVLEPAGALEIDALRLLPKKQIKNKTIVCIASGGNFDFERIAEVKERALKAAGLKKYFVVRLPQRPGALRELLRLLGPEDDIARFEYLKKSARNFGSILVGVETKHAENFDQLIDKMTDAGLKFQDITDDELVARFIV